jgi:hypothetical protein
MDLMFAFAKAVSWEDVAREVSVWMEYERHERGDVNPRNRPGYCIWWYINYVA